MKTYLVDVPETCVSTFKVKANSKEEAIEKILSGDYIDVEYVPGRLDFNTKNWRITEHEN